MFIDAKGLCEVKNHYCENGLSRLSTVRYLLFPKLGDRKTHNSLDINHIKSQTMGDPVFIVLYTGVMRLITYFRFLYEL
jgi:hypothetical protein